LHLFEQLWANVLGHIAAEDFDRVDQNLGNIFWMVDKRARILGRVLVVPRHRKRLK